MQSVYLQRIMKKNAAKGYKRTKPKQTQFKPNSNPIKACPERIVFTLSVIEGNGPILEAMIVNFCAKGYYDSKPTFAANNQNSSSPPPGVLMRESSRRKDKITLKIYPFGIDYPIVLKELKLTDSLYVIPAKAGIQ